MSAACPVARCVHPGCKHPRGYNALGFCPYHLRPIRLAARRDGPEVDLERELPDAPTEDAIRADRDRIKAERLASLKNAYARRPIRSRS